MNSLQKIVDWKKEEIKSLPPIRGIEMTLEIGRRHGLHDLESALQEPSMQIIAEVKRRFPKTHRFLDTPYTFVIICFVEAKLIIRFGKIKFC